MASKLLSSTRATHSLLLPYYALQLRAAITPTLKGVMRRVLVELDKRRRGCVARVALKHLGGASRALN